MSVNAAYNHNKTFPMVWALYSWKFIILFPVSPDNNKPIELSNFVGCFLTGTAAEVTPVSSIADNQYKVCDMIINLNESYQALVRKKKVD